MIRNESRVTALDRLHWRWMRFRYPDDAWFWTEEWQRGEREAQAAIDAGETVSFETADEVIAWLQRDDEQ